MKVKKVFFGEILVYNNASTSKPFKKNTLTFKWPWKLSSRSKKPFLAFYIFWPWNNLLNVKNGINFIKEVQFPAHSESGVKNRGSLSKKPLWPWKWCSRSKKIVPKGVPHHHEQVLFETFFDTMLRNEVIQVDKLKWPTLYIYIYIYLYCVSLLNIPFLSL